MVAWVEEGQMVIDLVIFVPPVGIRWYAVHFQMPRWRDPFDRIARPHVRHPYIMVFLDNGGYSAHRCHKEHMRDWYIVVLLYFWWQVPFYGNVVSRCLLCIRGVVLIRPTLGICGLGVL